MAETVLADLADPKTVSEVLAARRWPDEGVLILRGLIPADAIDAYCDRFLDQVQEPARGYGIGTPYMSNWEMRDLALHRNLTPHLERLVGGTVGLHLNLTGWKSTQRAWHVDSYLNPPYVGTHYAATWIALDTIHPDAGPFEYVPGSHRWPAPTQAKVLAVMAEDGRDPDWPWRSEAILGPLYDAEIAQRGAEVRQFTAEKGDVLIWHANLVHRGSVPRNPDLERRTLISHYSLVSARHDMSGTATAWKTDHADGVYFALGQP